MVAMVFLVVSMVLLGSYLFGETAMEIIGGSLALGPHSHRYY